MDDDPLGGFAVAGRGAFGLVVDEAVDETGGVCGEDTLLDPDAADPGEEIGAAVPLEELQEAGGGCEEARAEPLASGMLATRAASTATRLYVCCGPVRVLDRHSMHMPWAAIGSDMPQLAQTPTGSETADTAPRTPRLSTGLLT